MIAENFTFTVNCDGRICVLAASGEVDVVNAPKLAEIAAGVLSSQVERLVLDLGGLTFLDCAGARVLENIIESLPPGCPVIVRSISHPARSLLDLIGADLGGARPAAGGLPARRAARLVRQAEQARDRSQELITQTLRAAEQMAAVEQNAAITLAQLAAEHPRSADRLMALSQTARLHVALNRAWVYQFTHRRPALR